MIHRATYSSALFVLGLFAALAASCSKRSPPTSSSTVTLSASTAGPQAAGCELVDTGYGAQGTTPVRAETVVSGLEVPWSIAFLPDGDMLVTERPGRLRLVHQGALVPAPVANVPVARGDEGGLLGIALHPDFAANRLFFLYYTADNGGGRHVNRIERWSLAADARSARPSQIVFDGIAASPLHDGGRLRIGPDRMLYAGTGDARKPPSSQALDSPNGKILRLTLEGAPAPDNPWPGNPALIRGIRNTQGFDWVDARTLLVADHGPSGELGRTGHDEVNVARAGDNLGWPEIYGCQAREGMVTPMLTWREAVPPGGAVIYTGDAIPSWRGSFLLATLASKHLHRVDVDRGAWRVTAHEVYFQGEPPSGLGRLRDIVLGPDGQLYVTTSNCDGRGKCPAEKDRIVRIVPR